MEKKLLLKTTEPAGSIANKNGNVLENFFENILHQSGYIKVEPAQTLIALSKIKNQNQLLYARQVNIGQSIYDTKYICDFLVFHPEKFPDCLVVECKWQQSGGSVDSKYPYL